MPACLQPPEECIVVRQISEREAQDTFEEACRYFLQMSGDEFLRRWKRGSFGDRIDDVPGLMEVLSIVPPHLQRLL
jgi:hypothetical protein